MPFKIVGLALIAWGIADIFGSWIEFDVWRDILGIRLQGVISKFSGWIAIMLGIFVFSLSSNPSAGNA